MKMKAFFASRKSTPGRCRPSEMVRRYFSPAGAVIRSEQDGWLIVGAMLSKRTGQARVPADNAVSDLQIR